MIPREVKNRVSGSVNVVLMLLATSTSALVAQEPRATPLPAPPPMKTIAKEERDQFEREDTKGKVRKIIQLSDGHLLKAESFTNNHDFESASSELGMYWALMEHAFDLVGDMKSDATKTRDLYKRLELALRAQGPRLTSMRRITPLEFAVRIKEIEDFARNGRTEALNSFYGHTVVRESQTKPDSQTDKPQKGSSIAPERKP
jgi:hypothetical protein